MIDFVAARRIMVGSKVRTSDVTDLRVIASMSALPRERFLPAEQADLAYLDCDIPAAAAETGEPVRRLLKPMVLAKLLQAAEIVDSDHVLDVGCATGYASAVLAQLARSVVALGKCRAGRAGAGQSAGARHEPGAGRTRPLTDGWPPQAL